MAATMFSSDSDPTRKDSDLLLLHSPMATLPPSPGTTERTTTELKNSEVPLTSPSAQYAPVRSTESKDGELEEGEVVENPPAPNYPPLSSVERQDEEILPNTLTTQHVPSTTTKVEAGKLQDEGIPPTTSTVHYPLIPSIEIDDDITLSSSMTTHYAGAASWNANNIAPASRRAMGIALVNCVGNIGGILGSFMYIEKESPKYTTGFGLSLALGGVGFFVALFLEWTYKLGNAKKERIADDARVNYTEEQLFDMGDKSPLFKYVL